MLWKQRVGMASATTAFVLDSVGFAPSFAKEAKEKSGESPQLNGLRARLLAESREPAALLQAAPPQASTTELRGARLLATSLSTAIVQQSSVRDGVA